MLVNKGVQRDDSLWNSEAKNGRIWLHREIDVETGFIVSAHLDALERDGNTKDIAIDVNSYGGNIMASLSIIHRMMSMKTHVTTVCSGQALSAGLLIIAAGDTRKAYPNSRFLFHGNSSVLGYQKAPQHVDDAAEAARIDELISELLAKITKKNKKHWLNLCKTQKDIWISAETALEWGVIDEIIGLKK